MASSWRRYQRRPGIEDDGPVVIWAAVLGEDATVHTELGEVQAEAGDYILSSREDGHDVQVLSPHTFEGFFELAELPDG